MSEYKLEDLSEPTENRKKRQSIIEFLVKCGINLNYPPVGSSGIITNACLNNDCDMLYYLLKDLKLDPNNKDIVSIARRGSADYV